MNTRTASLVLVALLLAVTGMLRAQGWDPAPLGTPSPVPHDNLPPDQAAFFNWLDRNATTLPESQLQPVRERIYLYVSQLAKRNAGRFPSAGDSTAIRTLRAAAYMAVAGADMLARAVAPTLPQGEAIPIPEGLVLTFHAPLFSLASDDGAWAVCFPWYFMPAPLGRQTPSNGVSSEIAVISTLFAPDKGATGSSQATIMIAAAPVADSAKHVAMWLTQLGVTPAPEAGPATMGRWYAGPAGDVMRRQVVVRRLPRRIVLIAYLGLSGTFEANRPHFMNFLRTLAPARCAP